MSDNHYDEAIIDLTEQDPWWVRYQDDFEEQEQPQVEVEEQPQVEVLQQLQLQNQARQVEVQQLLQRIRGLRKPPSNRNKRMAMCKTKLEENLEKECSVCLDVPQYKNAVCTPCNHFYCKGCWAKWVKNKSQEDKRCPMCRTQVTHLTVFCAKTEKRVPKKVKTEENNHWSIFSIAREMLGKHFQ